MEKPLVSPLTPVTAQFPVDEYVETGVIAYNIADLPPGRMANTPDLVPSVRFLFMASIERVSPITLQTERVNVRKWTKWFAIKYSNRSNLINYFKGVPNTARTLQDDDTLFSTAFQIFVENQPGTEYSNILRVKLGKGKVDGLLYDIANFIPYKTVKAYGNLVPLRMAVFKTAEGIVRLSPDEMIDAPPEEA